MIARVLDPCCGGRMTARKAGGHTRTHAEMLDLGAVCVGSFAKHKFVMVRTHTQNGRRGNESRWGARA